MKIKSPLLGLLTLLIFFGGIALTAALNLWQTESSKTPVKFESGEASGEYNPADIRGSYSFGDIHDLFNIPLGDLKTAFLIPDEFDIASFQNKQLEEIYDDMGEDIEIGNSSVQLFVAFYKNLPYNLDSDIYLPSSAGELLEKRVQLTEEQKQYLQRHLVEISPTGVNNEENIPAPATQPEEQKNMETNLLEEHEESDYLVKGKTTFQEVIDWGVPLETIEELTGAPVTTPQMIIRDYCIANEIEFVTLKEALQDEVDQLRNP